MILEDFSIPFLPLHNDEMSNQQECHQPYNRSPRVTGELLKRGYELSGGFSGKAISSSFKNIFECPSCYYSIITKYRKPANTPMRPTQRQCVPGANF